jgi:16S rRNA (uracil1498-N3)-methyltransferase
VADHPADQPGPLAFVTDLEAPELADDDLHHLQRVLRLRAGAALTVGDGRGRWRTAVLSATGVDVTGPIEELAAPAPRLSVGFALVKGDKPELVVQKLTELGIDRIVPFRGARSVVRWDDAKAGKAVARLRSVARGAAMQSHRPHLPEIAEVADLEDLVAGEGVAMADRDGAAIGPAHTTVLVGPEGGWSHDERALSLPRVALGDHVLRAETAAITAGVLLCAQRGGCTSR